MIEAAWVISKDNTQSLAVKCGNCHKKMRILTNAKTVAKGPLCMCLHCGEVLYSPDETGALYDVVVSEGWVGGVAWLLKNSERSIDDDIPIPGI